MDPGSVVGTDRGSNGFTVTREKLDAILNFFQHDALIGCDAKGGQKGNRQWLRVVRFSPYVDYALKLNRRIRGRAK
jgi:hypothetical protein